MSVQSMTGFARREGTVGRYRWVWELRSVNGKGLDLRFRLPSGSEALEVEARRLASERFTRGNLQITLSIAVAEARIEAVVNRDALSAVLSLREELGGLVDPAPLRLDTLLSIRGLVDIREAEDGPEAGAARDKAIMEGFDQALQDLAAMRAAEGAALSSVLREHIQTIARLTDVVERDPSRTTEEIVKRLSAQVALLTEGSSALDRERLYAEAAILATKADVREEIDRLKAHIAAADDLLASGGPIGRRLDFLAQEFNRETNTICSKSNAAAVTAAGIDLKVVIDQFREQIQNLE